MSLIQNDIFADTAHDVINNNNMEFGNAITKEEATRQLQVFKDMAMGWMYENFKTKWIKEGLITREEIKKIIK